jgi:hypothetical protein
MGCVDRSIRELVKSARRTDNLFVSDETGQRFRLDIFGDEIFEAQHSLGFEKVKSVSFLCRGHVMIPLLAKILA